MAGQRAPGAQEGGNEAPPQPPQARRTATVGLDRQDDTLEVTGERMCVELGQATILGTASAVEPEQILQCGHIVVTGRELGPQCVEEMESRDDVPAGSSSGDRKAESGPRPRVTRAFAEGLARDLVVRRRMRARRGTDR